MCIRDRTSLTGIWVASAHFSGISGCIVSKDAVNVVAATQLTQGLCGQGRLDQGGMARVQKVLSRVQTKLAGIDSYPRPSVPLALGAHEAASPDGTSLRQAFAPIPRLPIPTRWCENPRPLRSLAKQL